MEALIIAPGSVIRPQSARSAISMPTRWAGAAGATSGSGTQSRYRQAEVHQIHQADAAIAQPHAADITNRTGVATASMTARASRRCGDRRRLKINDEHFAVALARAALPHGRMRSPPGPISRSAPAGIDRDRPRTTARGQKAEEEKDGENINEDHVRHRRCAFVIAPFASAVIIAAPQSH